MTTKKELGHIFKYIESKINGPLMKFYELYVNKRMRLREIFMLNATLLYAILKFFIFNIEVMASIK